MTQQYVVTFGTKVILIFQYLRDPSINILTKEYIPGKPYDDLSYMPLIQKCKVTNNDGSATIPWYTIYFRVMIEQENEVMFFKHYKISNSTLTTFQYKASISVFSASRDNIHLNPFNFIIFKNKLIQFLQFFVLNFQERIVVRNAKTIKGKLLKNAIVQQIVRTLKLMSKTKIDGKIWSYVANNVCKITRETKFQILQIGLSSFQNDKNKI